MKLLRTRRRRVILGVLTLVAVVVLALVLALALRPELGMVGQRGEPRPDRTTFVAIGDVPYGRAQARVLPRWVDEINASEPDFTLHLGDIQDGGTDCSDEEFRSVRRQFDRFAALVYTPGDNEWTDCHRTAKGAHDPLERLDAVRRIFFPEPGRTLGTRPMTVDSQAALGFPENVRFRRDGVVFATIHLTGSLDGTLPWEDFGQTSATPAQRAEQQQRMAAAVTAVEEAYREASLHHCRAVVIATQANVFDEEHADMPAYVEVFTPVVRALAEQSVVFDGQSHLVNGDSHVFGFGRPLASTSDWPERYGVGESEELRQVTVDGAENSKSFLRFTIEPEATGELLTWERVPFRAKE